MTMNNTNEKFNFKRFWAYLTKLLVERWRTNAMRLAILLGCIVMIEFWVAFATYDADSSSTDRAVEILFVVFAIILFVSGSFFASEMLSGARRKAERIGALTFPVTPFENWLARWIICIPLYLVCFLACLYLVDGLRVLFFSAIFPQIELKFIPIWGDSDSTSTLAVNTWLTYFLCTAVYALGGVFFVKRAILKTTLALFIFYWFGASIMLLFGALFSFSGGSFYESVLIWYGRLSVPFIWWLSYRCFKDMEVIDDLSIKRAKAWVLGYFVFTVLLVNVGAVARFSSDNDFTDLVTERKAVYLDRTTEQRIAPVSAVVFEKTEESQLEYEYGLNLSVEVNFVSDASQCSVIYPEQLIKVRQKGNTLYYAISDSLESLSLSNLELLSGPDGKTNSESAAEKGEISYLIKGADGKVRTAVDKNFTDDNKVRIIVNTLPGTLLVKQSGKQKTLLGEANMRSVKVVGGSNLTLNSQIRIDSLTVSDVTALNIGAAHINKMQVELTCSDEDEDYKRTRFEAKDKGLVNLVVIKGWGCLEGLSDVRYKRIEILPTEGKEVSLELSGIKRKMVIQGNE